MEHKFAVGDRVQITNVFDGSIDGKIGVVHSVDVNDNSLPYKVRYTDDNDSTRFEWCAEHQLDLVEGLSSAEEPVTSDDGGAEVIQPNVALSDADILERAVGIMQREFIALVNDERVSGGSLGLKVAKSVYGETILTQFVINLTVEGGSTHTVECAALHEGIAEVRRRAGWDNETPKFIPLMLPKS